MSRCLPVVLVLTFVLIGGCKKDGGGGGGGAAGPAGLGEKIAQDHRQMLVELTKLVQGNPPAGEVTPKIEALKEKYIKIHVASGKQREAMSPQDRKASDAALQSGMFAMPRDLQKTLVDASKAYRATNNDLANLIGSLNILTQYAAYDLLKKQLPKEAERLGIK